MEKKEVDTGEKLWGRYMVGTRVAIRFVLSFSREGVIPYHTMRLGASLASVTSLVLNCGALFRLERRNAVFRWTRGRRLRSLGGGKKIDGSSLHSSISV